MRRVWSGGFCGCRACGAGGEAETAAGQPEGRPRDTEPELGLVLLHRLRSPLYLFVPAFDEPFMLARKAVDRIRQEAPQLPLEVFRGSNDLIAIMERRGVTPSMRIAYTLDTTAYTTVARFQRMFDEAETVDISWDIRTLRMVKSEAEIAVQREAGWVMREIPELVKSSFRPGITELELSADLERYLRQRGHAALLRCRREGIEMAACGVCSAWPNSMAGTKFDGICGGAGLSAGAPYGASADPIPKRMPLIIDFGLNYHGYHVDQTRMFCWGEPPEEARAAYDAMLRAQQAAVDRLRPGVAWEDVYNAPPRSPSGWVRGDLHGSRPREGEVRRPRRRTGVGRATLPGAQMKDPLAAGMVVAIEPKVALPAWE